MLPRRKKPLRSGIERAPQREFPGHRQWVRQTHACVVQGYNWEPERTTGHSWVCRIHKAAVAAEVRGDQP